MAVAPIPDPAGRPGLGPDAAAARVAELFERHGRMVYGVCSAMLRHVHDAEDATQQVFLSAHRALLSGTRVRDDGAWLATIARNECRSRIATGMRTPLSVGEDDLATIAAHGDEAERRIQADALRDAMAELPERQREAVVLRYLFGLRYGEVAKALGLSRPATEALLFRARRTMRVRLRPVVGVVLVVPLAVRDELAAAIPGFASTGTSAAAAGAAGGLLAKLTAGPVGAKVAATAIAVSTVGTVGAVESDRSGRDASSRVPIVASVDVESSSDDESDGQSESSREAEDLSGDDHQSGSGGGDNLDHDRVLAGSDDDEREGQEDAGSSGSGSGDDDEIESGGSSDSSANSSSDDTTDDSSGPGPGDAEGGGEAEHESSATDSSGSGSEGSGDTESGDGEESSESSESESDSEDSESGEGP